MPIEILMLAKGTKLGFESCAITSNQEAKQKTRHLPKGGGFCVMAEI
jgi:hypothetical protein